MDTKLSELVSASRIPLRYREAWKKDQRDGPWRQSGQDVFSRLGKGGLFAFIGKSGVGKTQIGTNLLYNAMKLHGWPCLYATTRDFFLTIKATYHKDSPDTEEMVIANFTKPALLVLDECDKRGETQWEDGLLEHLLNRRYGAMKDTVLIANLNRSEFEKMVGPATLSRMNETGLIVVCAWPSFREGDLCG